LLRSIVSETIILYKFLSCVHSAQVPQAAAGPGGPLLGLVRQLRAATNTGFGGGGDPPDPPDPEKIAKALKHAEARAKVWHAEGMAEARARYPDPGAADAAAGHAAGADAAAGDDAADAAILAAAGHGGQAFPPLPAGNAAHVFLPDWTHGRIAGMHMNLIEGIVGIYSDKTE